MDSSQLSNHNYYQDAFVSARSPTIVVVNERAKYENNSLPADVRSESFSRLKDHALSIELNLQNAHLCSALLKTKPNTLSCFSNGEYLHNGNWLCRAHWMTTLGKSRL